MNNATSKLIALGLVVGLLAGGLHLIQGVLADRQQHRQQAVSSMGRSQEIAALEVRVRCTRPSEAGMPQPLMLSRPAASLLLQGNVQVEERARGIHRTNVYGLKARATARWPRIEPLRPPNAFGQPYTCSAPVIALDLTHVPGVRAVRLQLNGRDVPVVRGAGHGTTLQAPLPALAPDEPLVAELTLELAGVESLSLFPLAETADVRLQGNWAHPSFAGSTLPSERQVGPAGFNARWQLTSLQASDPGQPAPRCGLEQDDEVGAGCTPGLRIGFVDPVGTYTLTDRSTKYGLLFVLLTFGAVGLLEVTQRLRVHPVQYLLTGSALTLFFLLLLSLSEYLAFGTAYAIAAGACMGLLGCYAVSMLRGWRRGVPFAAGIALLYGLLYVLLRLEQTALVVGSTALFLILAAVMLVTRRLDWYGLAQPSTPPATSGAPDAPLNTLGGH